MQFTPSGIPGLDTILHGGFPKGSSIIIEGAPGTGKTTLGIQFLHYGAVELNEPGIYISFEEFPEQIYMDAKAFGWDLPNLEKQDLIRIVCMSPEVFVQQLREPDSALEQMIRQIKCKRIVIDSVSIFRYGMNLDEQHRQMFYSFRNTLRKWSLTALLLQEQSSQEQTVAFENFVVDGVVQLSLKATMEKYRMRTLEVLKMRGTRIMEGENVYRFTESGIRVLPSLTLVEDKILSYDKELIPTGISKLDQLLSGGIPNGTAFLLDTNSKANYKHLLASIFAQRFQAGHKFISLNSSLTSIEDFEKALNLYSISLKEAVSKKEIFFIEHYNRPAPPEYQNAIIDVSALNNEEYKTYIREKLSDVIRNSLANGEKWFVYYDLNTIFSQRGADFVNRFFAEEVASAKAYGITILALCNFSEIHPEVSSYLERTSNGVIRTWVDGNYQYIQLTKSPTGTVSEPLIVESTNELPFVSLF